MDSLDKLSYRVNKDDGIRKTDRRTDGVTQVMTITLRPKRLRDKNQFIGIWNKTRQNVISMEFELQWKKQVNWATARNNNNTYTISI